MGFVKFKGKLKKTQKGIRIGKGSASVYDTDICELDRIDIYIDFDNSAFKICKGNTYKITKSGGVHFSTQAMVREGLKTGFYIRDDEGVYSLSK